MKLPLSELIESVREEFYCYEEGIALFECWKKEFLQWIDKNKSKHKDIFMKNDKISIQIKDEDEIFEIVDSYLDAIECKTVQSYWKNF